MSLLKIRDCLHGVWTISHKLFSGFVNYRTFIPVLPQDGLFQQVNKPSYLRRDNAGLVILAQVTQQRR